MKVVKQSSKETKQLQRRRYYLSEECSGKLDTLAKQHNTTPSLMLESIITLM